MADGNALLREPALNLLVEIEQPHAVRDGCAALADFLGDVLLPQPKLTSEAREGIGFFDRVEIFTLQVLDQREFEDVLIGRFANDHGRLGQTDLLRGTPAAFAGDQFKEISAPARDQRLDDPVFFDRSDEFFQVLIAKDGPWLERRGDNLRETDELHALAAFDGGCGRSHARIDQRAETFAECNFCHRGRDCSGAIAETQLPFGRVATTRLAGATWSLYRDGVLFPDLIEVLDPEPHDAALNMAIDETLLRCAEQPTLRVYRWRNRAVSFGYFGKIDEVRQMAEGREVVRRWTGGGIVEHGDDLTYTLVIPRTSAVFRLSASESYRTIHEAIAGMLLREGRVASVAPVAAGKVSNACFANPVQYDLVAEGAKVAGAAQRRTRWGLLHQGSMQMESWPPHLWGRLAEAFGANVSRHDLTAETLSFARQLSAEKYATIAWLQKF